MAKAIDISENIPVSLTNKKQKSFNPNYLNHDFWQQGFTSNDKKIDGIILKFKFMYIIYHIIYFPKLILPKYYHRLFRFVASIFFKENCFA